MKTFDDYRAALIGASPRVKERLLAQANQEKDLDAFQLRELQRLADPDAL